MGKSILDSPWMHLLEKNYESPANYAIDTAEDTSPRLEKATAELETEIQAERKAKLKKIAAEQEV